MVVVNNPGDWGQVYAPLLHAPWHGWTPTDLIFPFFVFGRRQQDVQNGVSVAAVAARFHNGLAHAVVEACRQVRAATGVRRVALSGGVWQNRLLLRHTTRHLEHDGFGVLVHQRVPTNDGGLALGQAVVAGPRLQCASAATGTAAVGS